MTPSNNNSYMEITENDYQSQNETNESGSKITEFIKEETRISGSGTNGGTGTAGTNGGGGGSGYNYTHDVNCSSCHTGHNTCTGGTVSYNCNDCHTGSNTCAYGCDTRYDECLTGENTCKYGCDSETIQYKPGQGGNNIINSPAVMISSTNGSNSGNGKFKISYLREN